jgi:hypothetical protein
VQTAFALPEILFSWAGIGQMWANGLFRNPKNALISTFLAETVGFEISRLRVIGYCPISQG